MIKKQYQEPEIDVMEINIIDVILTSQMSNEGNATWDNEDMQDSNEFFQ